MPITRRSLSDTYDQHDTIIEAAQAAKRDATQAYRKQLDSQGMDKDSIKVEIDGFKVAYRRLVAIQKKGSDEVEHRDAIADEIFLEITAPRAPRATRVEIIDEFDAETGEFIEPHTAPSPQVVQADHESTEAGTARRDNSTEGEPAPVALNPEAAITPPASESPPVDAFSEPGNGRLGAMPGSAGAQSTGNVDGSAGRSHSQIALSTESTASVPVDTHSIAKINAGGEDVDAAADNAGGGDSLPAVASNVTPFVPKPHDDPLSSKGLRRHKMCRDLELCAGNWRDGCHGCRTAQAVAVPIIGSIGQ